MEKSMFLSATNKAKSFMASQLRIPDANKMLRSGLPFFHSLTRVEIARDDIRCPLLVLRETEDLSGF